MPPLTVLSSPNIATLDSNIVMDLCAGQIYTDLTPSVYIGDGASNVLGAKIQITNPFNVVIRAFPTDYDMTPALSGQMNAVISFPMPTQANNFQYGNYIISAQLTDSDGTKYTVTKTISICAPDPLNKTKKYGTLGAKLSGICNQGKVFVLVDNEPTYKGFISDSAVRNFTLDYPTGSGKTPEATAQPSFSVQLFEGVYKIYGTSCAHYSYGDNVAVKVPYQVNFSKPIICSLDECCVFTGLDALNQKLNSDCSDQEKQDTQDRVEKATLLLDTIDFAVRCGEDPSDYISQLEDVLGLTCSCNFDDGTPLINNNPSSDILVQGCNVSSEVVGLTKVYTIDNYSYTVSVEDNGGALTAADATLDGCVKNQPLTFNIGTVYSQIKGLANGNGTEANFWASVIKKPLNSLDLSCMGIDNTTLQAMSFEQVIQAIANQSCLGGDCVSTIDTILATQNGGNVVLSWSSTGAFTVDIFVDGILMASLLSAFTSYTLNGYADGVTHIYKIIPRCNNGVAGTAKQDTFGFTGCAAIAKPVLSNTTIINASCPFDLTGLISSLPAGITQEWHTANNTLPTTLVPDETSVSDGVYYVFATDGDNCYSTGTKVTITCGIASSCTAPQSLVATSIIGATKISFVSAAYPPPANSYTVKRKAQADTDIDGSYVTIGTPTYNVSTGKWEITDPTATSNTYYTYKAVSNCGMTTPYIKIDFANINCPSPTLSSGSNYIGYSFSDTGGEIDQYKVELWDITGETLLHTDTFTPAFPSPIIGQFDYLDEGVNYKVRIVPYIGANSFPCAFYNRITSSALSVGISKSGSFSGILTALVSGGTAPYTYLFSCVASGGACEAHDIFAPTSMSSGYECTAYSGVTYQFSVLVTDSLGATGSADAIPVLPCLVPETMIMVKDGNQIRLDSLQVGDELFGDNKVESIDEHIVNKLYVINNGLLKASEGHIHIVSRDLNEELVQSSGLTIWDSLLDKDDNPVKISSIVILEGEFKVINISTTTKEYIANEVRTHNKIACP